MSDSQKIVIVGLAGLSGAGKDTVARILCAEHGFTRVAQGDGIRGVFRDLDGPTQDFTREIEKAGKTSRWAQQTLGNECRHELDSDGQEFAWIDLVRIKLLYAAKYHPVPRHRFVITDVRRTIESMAFWQLAEGGFGGIGNGVYECWRITRPRAGLTGPEAAHASERTISEVRHDRIITNDGTLRQLASEVDRNLKDLLS